MPRLKDQALECVFYLYPSVQAAQDGEAAGGTGCFVSVPSRSLPDRCYTYAVTNSHVVREGGAPVIRLRSKLGGHQVIPLAKDDWVHHPEADDVAACLFVPPKDAAYRHIQRHMWATREQIQRYNIGPGDDVCMVGRFINHEGKETNLPTVRFGNIAMMPWEPIRGSRGIRQESYLVECRSLSGYSGSPVFVYQSATHLGDPRNEQVPFLLLGLDWCHPNTWEPVYEKNQRDIVPAGWVVKANSGMAGVVPAWKIGELLDEEIFLKFRQQEDARIGENRGNRGKPQLA